MGKRFLSTGECPGFRWRLIIKRSLVQIHLTAYEIDHFPLILVVKIMELFEKTEKE